MKIFMLFLTFVVTGSLPGEKSVFKKDYRIKPVLFTSVRFHDNFWAPKIETNRKVSIPSAFKKCEETGRIDNFAVAGGLKPGEFKGDYPFDDTDVYKVLEGASYALAVKYDRELDEYLDGIIRLIAAAQEEDGYLYTCRTSHCTRKNIIRWMGTKRWQRLNSHELYNCGHLYEAAAAHYLATGKTNLLDIAIKNADLVARVFGPGENQKHTPSGHPIIEMASIPGYQYAVKNDGFDPRDSSDTDRLFFYWWLKKGTMEWVEYTFDQPYVVSGIQVYWLYFDHYDYECRPPRSWEILYRKGDRWVPVHSPSQYTTEINRYNTVTFSPVKTNGLRIAAQLQKGYSAGIMEWKVFLPGKEKKISIRSLRKNG